MSVIVLTTDGDARTVVTSSDEFKREGSAVLIRGEDPEQLRSDSKECNDGYDLRVGSLFRDHRNSYGHQLGEQGRIRLLPGNAVIIQTEEWVEFPDRCFGQIFPKVTLLTKGIGNVTSKVDPGFKGHLFITVFNYGKRIECLGRRDRFCSLHLLNVKGPVRPYDKPPPSIGVPGSATWHQRVGDWIDAYGARLSVMAVVVGAIGAVFTLILQWFLK